MARVEPLAPDRAERPPTGTVVALARGADIGGRRAGDGARAGPTSPFRNAARHRGRARPGRRQSPGIARAASAAQRLFSGRRAAVVGWSSGSGLGGPGLPAGVADSRSGPRLSAFAPCRERGSLPVVPRQHPSRRRVRGGFAPRFPFQPRERGTDDAGRLTQRPPRCQAPTAVTRRSGRRSRSPGVPARPPFQVLSLGSLRPTSRTQTRLRRRDSRRRAVPRARTPRASRRTRSRRPCGARRASR